MILPLSQIFDMRMPNIVVEAPTFLTESFPLTLHGGNTSVLVELINRAIRNFYLKSGTKARQLTTVVEELTEMMALDDKTSAAMFINAMHSNVTQNAINATRTRAKKIAALQERSGALAAESAKASAELAALLASGGEGEDEDEDEDEDEGDQTQSMFSRGKRNRMGSQSQQVFTTLTGGKASGR
jgi:SOS response regulatory protein OraA/RecX